MNTPTYEQLLKENEALREENEGLRRTVLKLVALVKELEAKIEGLQAKLGKNSKNSSQPPSSDQKPNHPVTPKEESRPYHTGAKRALLPLEAITSRETRLVRECPRCCAQMTPTDEVQIGQQVELPPLKLSVHQIELVTTECPHCKLRVRPQLLPQEVFLLGPRLEAFVNLLLGQYRQGHEPVRSLLAALFPLLQISKGLISKIKRRAAAALNSSYEELVQAISSSRSPLHADATSWRHEGHNEYAIVMRSQAGVAFAITPNQNKQTIGALLGKKVELLVTDRGLASSEVKSKAKQYCFAHLLRNLQGLAEHPGTTPEEAQQLGTVYDEVKALFIDKHRLTQGEIHESTWRQYGYKHFEYLQETLEEGCAQGKRLGRFCRRLLRSLKQFRTYLRDPSLPMTNNPAEEALRSLVIARKLCFGTRSHYGKKWRMAIHSCIETLHRRGHSVLEFLVETISSFRCRQPTPSLLLH